MTNSVTSSDVSEYRLKAVRGSENWEVFVRVCDMVGMPYVCQNVSGRSSNGHIMAMAIPSFLLISYYLP